MNRKEIVEEIFKIDYWGARAYGPAMTTAERVVTMLEEKGLLMPDGCTTETVHGIAWGDDPTVVRTAPLEFIDAKYSPDHGDLLFTRQKVTGLTPWVQVQR